AALGQRTRRMRLGPAVAVPAFHNPLILAEEYTFADNLCGGRLEFALGSGFSPVEFQTFGMTMDEARERFWEAADVILKAWREETFSHHGKYYRYENAGLYVKPAQKPTPPIWRTSKPRTICIWSITGARAIARRPKSWPPCTCTCIRAKNKPSASAALASSA